jgi:hypothetical protein
MNDRNLFIISPRLCCSTLSSSPFVCLSSSSSSRASMFYVSVLIHAFASETLGAHAKSEKSIGTSKQPAAAAAKLNSIEGFISLRVLNR